MSKGSVLKEKEIGAMFLEFQELKEQRACLRVNLERARQKFEEAAKRVDFVLTDSDWKTSDDGIDDNGRLSDYPDRAECIGWIQEYDSIITRLDKLTDTFKELGVEIN